MWRWFTSRPIHSSPHYFIILNFFLHHRSPGLRMFVRRSNFMSEKRYLWGPMLCIIFIMSGQDRIYVILLFFLRGVAGLFFFICTYSSIIYLVGSLAFLFRITSLIIVSDSGCLRLTGEMKVAATGFLLLFSYSSLSSILNYNIRYSYYSIHISTIENNWLPLNKIKLKINKIRTTNSDITNQYLSENICLKCTLFKSTNFSISPYTRSSPKLNRLLVHNWCRLQTFFFYVTDLYSLLFIDGNILFLTRLSL